MEEADLNNDKRIDYKEFSRLVMGTIENTKKLAKKKMKKISNTEFSFGNKSKLIM